MDRFINIAWIFGKKYKEYEDKIKLSELLIKKIVSDLYENRELWKSWHIGMLWRRK